MLTKEMSAALKARFKPEQVSWRVQGKSADGKPLALAYIDARNVMDRLDEVVGSENWAFDWDAVVVENGAVKVAKGKLSLFGGAPKCDIGDSGGIEPNKSAVSDALKRCAVHFGVGRYLYDLEAEPVQVVGGRIPAAELKRLQALLSGEAPARQMTPGEACAKLAHELNLDEKAYRAIVASYTQSGKVLWANVQSALETKLAEQSLRDGHMETLHAALAAHPAD